jgi:hypothetical protein
MRATRFGVDVGVAGRFISFVVLRWGVRFDRLGGLVVDSCGKGLMDYVSIYDVLGSLSVYGVSIFGQFSL